MEQRYSWEANGSSVSQEIPFILWNLNVHPQNHTKLPRVPVVIVPARIPLLENPL